MNYLEELLEQAQAEVEKLLAENKRMRERLVWLKSEPADSKLTFWQKLVVREGLGLSMHYCDLPKEEPKPSTFAEGSLGVKITKLAAYFEKRAKENAKRAKDKEEQSKSLRVGGFCSNWANEAENSGYYFSGKADSYQRASEKVKELLREPEEPTVSDAPAEKWIGDPEEPTFSDAPAEKWVVECHFPEGWLPSGNTGLCKVEFASEEEAQRAIEEYGSEPLKYRVVRKGLATLHQDVPEKWIVEAEFYSGWYRSASVPEEFTTKSEADAAIAKQTDGVLRRARKVDWRWDC